MNGNSKDPNAPEADEPGKAPLADEAEAETFANIEPDDASSAANIEPDTE